MKRLKWYHYAAKLAFLILFSFGAPIFILMALALGLEPFWYFKCFWYQGTEKDYIWEKD